MNDSILLVDDEPRILSAFRRQLQAMSPYKIETAPAGPAALELMAGQSNFSVIVSDMKMPGMDGVALLKEVEKRHPNTVRVMLTGITDQETSVEAINEGHIFRFLTKPCSAEKLLKAVDDGVKQYRLITAEKDLLQNTLGGTIKMLTEILSMIDPAGFGQGMSLRERIRDLGQNAGLPSTWDAELAAMLAHIGRIIIPTEVAAKLAHNQQLLPEEMEVLARVPDAGHRLLSNIPRLEKVAEIVRYQDKHFDGTGIPSDGACGEKIPLGARILTLVRDFEEQKSKGASDLAALEILIKRGAWYDPLLLKVLSGLCNGEGQQAAKAVAPEVFDIAARELVPGQVLLAPVVTKDGVLLISAGTLLSETSVERLQNYARLIGIKEPIKVNCRIPSRE